MHAQEVSAVLEANVLRVLKDQAAGMPPRIGHHLQPVVIARNLKTGRDLIGGLGALGVGLMWVDHCALHRRLPGFSNAPLVEERTK